MTRLIINEPFSLGLGSLSNFPCAYLNRKVGENIFLSYIKEYPGKETDIQKPEADTFDWFLKMLFSRTRLVIQAKICLEFANELQLQNILQDFYENSVFHQITLEAFCNQSSPKYLLLYWRK